VDSNRKTAAIVGVLYLVGTASGGLSRIVTGPVLGAQDRLLYISANQSQMIAGALLVLLMGLALAMVPVMVFPVLRKTSERLAMGYVVFRGGLETFTYIVMTFGWLSLVPLSRAYVQAAAQAPGFQALGTWLLETKQMSGILGIVFPLGALMFYSLLYRSRLIPRWISVWGLIAAVPYLASGVLDMFSLASSWSAVRDIVQAPMALQELVLAVWLIAKGFSPPVLAAPSAAAFDAAPALADAN
jgi:hypothetical protein